MVSLDEWLTLYAGTFIFPFPTQWFATILSVTEMTKLGHNNPFPFTVLRPGIHGTYILYSVNHVLLNCLL